MSLLSVTRTGRALRYPFAMLRFADATTLLGGETHCKAFSLTVVPGTHTLPKPQLKPPCDVPMWRPVKRIGVPPSTGPRPCYNAFVRAHA